MSESSRAKSRTEVRTETAGPSSGLPAWQLALIGLAAVLVYLPALRGGFIWNDADYVTRGELQSLGGLTRIWFEVGATEQYYPLLHSFFWLQHRLWGDAPLGYHLVNVLMHAGCAMLLAMVVARLFAGRAATPLTAGSIDDQGGEGTRRPTANVIALLSGLIFAVHPVYVESVAWISEQKNTFSLFWYLLAGLIYLRWQNARGRAEAVPKPGSRSNISAEAPPQPYPQTSIAAGSSAFAKPTADKSSQPYLWWRQPAYWLATGCFILALLSKSLTASLPCALLVVTWWRSGRLGRSTWAPLIPWVVLGAVAGAFTGWVEHSYIGAKGEDYALSFVARGVLAGRVIWFYLAKYAWPADLSFIYPRWEIDASQAWQWLFPLGAMALLFVLWRFRGRARGPLAGYLLFVGSLVPTIGFFNVYAFKFSYVADHWNYLPSLALAVMAAWGGVEMAARFAGRARDSVAAGMAENCGGERSRRPTGWILVAGVGLAALGFYASRQIAPYRELETFYREGLRRNPDSWMMHQNLGVLLVQTERVPEAIPHFVRELELRPREAEGENNYGVALAKLGKSAEALVHFERAVQLKPKYAEAWLNVGIARRDLGQTAGAVTALEEVVRLQPQAAEAFYELGSIAAEAGRATEAIARFEQALQIRPDYPAAAESLGRELAAAGRPTDAIARFEQALKLAPTAGLYDGLGALQAGTGQLPAAQQSFERALALDPRRPGTHFNLGLVLAQSGRVSQAVKEFEQAVALKPDYADAFQALAQGYAETGRQAEARAAQTRAAQLRSGPR